MYPIIGNLLIIKTIVFWGLHLQLASQVIERHALLEEPFNAFSIEANAVEDPELATLQVDRGDLW